MLSFDAEAAGEHLAAAARAERRLVLAAKRAIAEDDDTEVSPLTDRDRALLRAAVDELSGATAVGHAQAIIVCHRSLKLRVPLFATSGAPACAELVDILDGFVQCLPPVTPEPIMAIVQQILQLSVTDPAPLVARLSNTVVTPLFRQPEAVDGAAALSAQLLVLRAEAYELHGALEALDHMWQTLAVRAASVRETLASGALKPTEILDLHTLPQAEEAWAQLASQASQLQQSTDWTSI